MRRSQASGPAETIYTEGMADSAKPVPHKILGKKSPIILRESGRVASLARGGYSSKRAYALEEEPNGFLMKQLLMALALIVGLASAAGVVLAETRVALVIGNDEYATLPNLNNAGNDARGVAAKLKSLGFETILHTNVGRRELGRTLARFQDQLAKADVGLVFYAGHGIQLDGKNYLVPSDARIEVEEDLRFEAIQASEFLETMANAGTPLNIVIIDACRDNPLPKRSRSGLRGLAIVAVPKSIKGTAILYSAGAGPGAASGERPVPNPARRVPASPIP